MSSSGVACPGYGLCHEDGHHRGPVPARPAGYGVCSDGAPGAPGTRRTWTAADKDGYGTSAGHDQQGLAHAPRRRAERGLLPGPRDAERARRWSWWSRTARRSPSGRPTRPVHRVQLADARSLTYRQVTESPGRFRVTKTYGPTRRATAAGGRAVGARSVGQEARRLRPLRPEPGNNGDDDSGRTAATRCARATAAVASALAASPGLHAHVERLPRARATAGRTCARTSAWTGPTTSAAVGNVVQTAKTRLTGRDGARG